MKCNIHFFNTIEDIILNENIGVLKVPLCNSKNCGIELEKKLELSILGTSEKENNNCIYKCVICKNGTQAISYLSKKY